MKLVTHSGKFHTDDVFAAAALRLAFSDSELEFVRTRDADEIAVADVVFDVGGEYDPERKRFDHHQKGGAGERENGIPYAAFGLVWRHYGEEVSGSADVARRLDEKLAQAIDAIDNGVELMEAKFDGVYPYVLQNVISTFEPTWKDEKDTFDSNFMEAVDFAQGLLGREIKRQKDKLEGMEKVVSAYEASDDRRIVVMEAYYPWHEVLAEYEEPLFVVAPASDSSGNWQVYTIRVDQNRFEARKSFPEAWAGKTGHDLAEVSGVSDAVFCHDKRFIAVAGSKEGVVALAHKAINQIKE